MKHLYLLIWLVTSVSYADVLHCSAPGDLHDACYEGTDLGCKGNVCTFKSNSGWPYYKPYIVRYDQRTCQTEIGKDDN